MQLLHISSALQAPPSGALGGSWLQNSLSAQNRIIRSNTVKYVINTSRRIIRLRRMTHPCTTVLLYYTVTLRSHCGHTAVTLRSHCGYTMVMLWSHYDHTAVTLRSHYGHTAVKTKVKLRLHNGRTTVTLWSHYGYTLVRLRSHYDHTAVTLRSHYGHTAVETKVILWSHYGCTTITLHGLKFMTKEKYELPSFGVCHGLRHRDFHGATGFVCRSHRVDLNRTHTHTHTHVGLDPRTACLHHI